MAELEKACEDSCGCRAEANVSVSRVYWLQGLTIGWMLVECGVSLYAALQAHSVALFIFGSDSLVELSSAVVVILQFAPRFAIPKHAAERTSALLLYLLAVIVVCICVM